MKKYILALAATFLLSSCATQMKKNEQQQFDPLKWEAQRTSTAPAQGIIDVEVKDLVAGDILLSSAKGLTSLGIRTANFTSVSHAFLYIGDNQVAEAVGSGINVKDIDESMKEDNLIAVYRHPLMTPEHAEQIRQFALSHEGEKYNFWGVAKQAPYSLTRKICEFPLIPREVRYACLNSMAYIQIGKKEGSERFFCSQFVLEGFKQASLPLVDAPSDWFSPSDILRMREDDVPPIKTNVELKYVGHLLCRPSLLNGNCKYQPKAPIDNGLAIAPEITPAVFELPPN